MQRHKRLIAISSILLFTLACNMSTSAPATQVPLEVKPEIMTAVEETLRAGGLSLATPIYTYTPSVTPPPTSTPFPTSTPTPSIPMVSVSVDTSCRSGPGQAYAYLGVLRVGETAQVVGKHSSTGYWIIVNPAGFGDCWLWGQQATVNGSTDHLMEYAQPAIPTPSIPNAPSNFVVTSKNCGATMDIIFSWTDNSSVEDGFKLYQSSGLTHIIGYNRISHNLSLSYLPSQIIRLELSAFNMTGESVRQVVELSCP